ncbi:MAG: hypothetical protein UT34_C0002G0316 [candidate division WS6 bacterium GW2011_GWF2_39_15]|uniref:DUF5667 domain-containing protein n=1 Tax=candidate division WS6 bacterium GW2011_GWF2_39_15 TaxID=1619100 RepID=A0A0G0MP15_9BACT|nr:MAG: hypothetical protein UT34_C0002G0316 [candidate division WS6 bacterium GW2011_GWF2_39_15]
MSAALIAIVTGIVALLGVGGTAVASNSAVPGDFLYPVDTLVENVQRSLIFDAVNESEFELKVLDERVEELKKLSVDGEVEDIDDATKALEQQQLRIQERVQEMNQLREKNELKGEDQLKVMEQLKSYVSEHQSTLNQIKSDLEDSGNSDAGKSVSDIQTSYEDDFSTEVSDFETDTGLEVQESESNQGEDSEIKNQNETQNAGEDSGSDNDNGSDGSSGKGK